VGAQVFTHPGPALEEATILIRDGVFEGVGKGLTVPADARVWDLKGRVVYAGFIDPYVPTAAGTNLAVRPRAEAEATQFASGRLNFFGVPGQERDPGLPGPGSELSTITPERRAATQYAPDSKLLTELRELGFTAINTVPTRGCIRGTSAFALLSEVNPNEAILRADVFQHVSLAEESEGGRESGYPQSLMGLIAAVRQTFLDAAHHRDRIAFARQHPEPRHRVEFNPSLESLFPAIERQMPVLFEPGSVLIVDRAARIGRELGVDFAMLACGQEWRRPDLAAATGASFIVPLQYPELPKLPDEDDWEQVTLDALRAWDWAPENAAMLRARGRDVALTTHGLADRKQFRKHLQLAMDRGLTEVDALAALTTIPARLCGLQDRLGTIEPGRLANLTVVEGKGYFDPEARVEAVWIDGRVYPSRIEEKKAAKPAPVPSGVKEDGLAGTEERTRKQNEKREWRRKRVAREPLASRGVLAEPPSLLIRGATVWTSGPQGLLEESDILVAGGKIQAVGRGLAAGVGDPSIIDGRGLHVTPGLIDAHSHSMVLGGVNEMTLPSTAMVRIGDVVNSETANIYWQLAGGLTAANQLHGSANPIGGQNAVIKLKDGASPDELLIRGAPTGIKFALGENVKQSNAGDRNTTRFPQSRMGVPVFMANRFTAARRYLLTWETYRKSPKGSLPPPRRDLELEAIGEIIQGERLIHCHSYRQDEILAFLRTMEDFGVRVGTLQHVLEGYKVADEMARHGAGGSCFSDWWAYKFEVIDAIPYAGSLMRERGVLVSFNSDSSDHARRLNTEAAKAVKYGGTPEPEALAFVTINAAKQLGIDRRVGSIEPGKDADLAIWSGPPLDSRSVCLQTWIEGRKYFDRDLDAARTEAFEQERLSLIEKAKKLTPGGGEGGASETGRNTFFMRALEHRFDGADRHCMEDER
jgi:imidazolonepropionase-like amidohydrolase